MATCRNCGNLGNIQSDFCPNCGEPLTVKAAEEKAKRESNAVYGDFNPNFNNGGTSKTNYDSDNTSALFCVLGFCFPIVGLILYLVLMNDKPQSAKAAGIGALVGFILGVLGTLISFGLQTWFPFI
jgi:hypothetical protein